MCQWHFNCTKICFPPWNIYKQADSKTNDPKLKPQQTHGQTQVINSAVYVAKTENNDLQTEKASKVLVLIKTNCHICCFNTFSICFRCRTVISINLVRWTHQLPPCIHELAAFLSSNPAIGPFKFNPFKPTVQYIEYSLYTITICLLGFFSGLNKMLRKLKYKSIKWKF